VTILVDNDAQPSHRPPPAKPIEWRSTDPQRAGSGSSQTWSTGSATADENNVVRIVDHGKIRATASTSNGRDALELFELHPVTLEEVARQLACTCNGYKHSESCEVGNAVFAKCHLEPEGNAGGGAQDTVQITEAEGAALQQGGSEAVQPRAPGFSRAEEKMLNAILDMEACRRELAMAQGDAKLDDHCAKPKPTTEQEPPQQAKQRRFQEMLAKLNKPAEDRYRKLISSWVDPETGASEPDSTWSVLEMFA
jgi:hypothetical protein